jgi:hypothetical protein
MSIRTTITLDDDFYERLKQESKTRGMPFRQTINDVIRSGFLAGKVKLKTTPFEFKTFPMGTYPGISYDNTEQLIELGEGEFHR